MDYEYIQRAYGLTFKPKMRVRHTVTGNSGEVRRPGPIASSYVSVRFDGMNHNRPCHPEELEILQQ